RQSIVMSVTRYDTITTRSFIGPSFLNSRRRRVVGARLKTPNVAAVSRVSRTRPQASNHMMTSYYTSDFRVGPNAPSARASLSDAPQDIQPADKGCVVDGIGDTEVRVCH